MPECPQEPLSPIAAAGYVRIHQRLPPHGAGYWFPCDQYFYFDEVLQYYGNHTWGGAKDFMVTTYDEWGWGSGIYQAPMSLDYQVSLSWGWQIIHSAQNWNPQGTTWCKPGYFTPGWIPCDQGSPWATCYRDFDDTEHGHSIHIRFYRDLSPLAAHLPMFVSSPTVHGTIGRHCVVRGPVYPEGAVPGQTTPDRTVTYMRRRPHNVFYTDNLHTNLRAGITSAADQWNALTPTAKLNWNRAAKTTRPPLTGYALWTQIIQTKRLDRIRTLQARTGLSLEIPALLP
jgi:hypothetical protein